MLPMRWLTLGMRLPQEKDPKRDDWGMGEARREEW